jgi:hypothetical protein
MNALFDWLFGRVDSSPASGSAGSGESSPDVYSPDRRLTFDETVSHMARGYDNTQRVIQFMDAKAGAVVALALAIFAFVGKVVAWAYGQTSADVIGKYPCLLVSALVLLGGAVLACGFGALHFAFRTVRPNHLPDAEAFSTLFPAHSLEGKEEAKRRLRPIVTGTDCGFVIDEFQRQLLAVGEIVHRKINWLRTSIQCLWWQGLASVFLGALVSWMGMSGKLVKLESKPDAGSVPAANGKAVGPSSAPAQQVSPVK